jgi:Glycoside-hydrolase family GH114
VRTGALLPVGLVVAVSVVLGAPWLSAATSAADRTGTHTGTASRIVRPPANGRFDYQIGGAYRPLLSVQIVDRDHTSRPVTGRYNICYINAFQTQAEDDRWWRRRHPALLLRDHDRRLVEDPGWPGEILLNTATASDRRRLATIEDKWIDGCRTKGFEGVEPDNLDSNTRSHGLLTQADDLAFARLLAKRAHRDGLAIAQKNDAEASRRARHAAGFDFAIAEECQVYNECGYYTRAYGDRVIEIEYTDNGRSAFRTSCRLRGRKISIILRDRDVVPRGARGYTYQAC